MQVNKNDRLWMLAGFVLLVWLLIYGVYEAYKSTSNDSLVKISLKTIIPDASVVKVAGSFNNWQEQCCLMRTSRPNEWAIELTLKPGVYEYMFIVDGEQHMPQQSAGNLHDGLGGRNSVIYVNRTVVKQGGGNV